MFEEGTILIIAVPLSLSGSGAIDFCQIGDAPISA